jgi:replication factor C large subunit
MSIPWTIKYKPQRISEFVGNRKAVQQLSEWLLSWGQNKSSKKASFLYGPPGLGKTVLAEILSKEHGFDLIEMNASDSRNKVALEKIVGMASIQSPLFGAQRRMILLDELEGLNPREDSKGISAIVNIIKNTRYPLILTADSAWDTRFSNLRNHCFLIQFKRIPTRSIIPSLRKICQKEGIKTGEGSLKLIAERAKGDLRSAITDLQALSQGKEYLAYSDVSWLDARNRQEAIFDVLRLIFTTKKYILAKKAVDLADVDYKMLFEWIYENLPYQLTDSQDLYNGLEALAKADLYFNRIKIHQYWPLLKYALDLMTAGVAMAREKTIPKWVPFKFPGRIRMLSKTRRERQQKLEVGRRLKEKCHTSTITIVREYLPYLRIIFEHNNEMAVKIAEGFNLDDETIDYLKRNTS